MGCNRSREEIEYEEPPVKVTKILLLGISESGKTTLRNQMRFTEVNSFSADMLLKHRNTIQSNLTRCFVSVIEAMEITHIDYDSVDNEAHARELSNLVLDDTLPFDRKSIKKHIVALLNDTGIQRCSQTGLGNISDDTPYLFENAMRIISGSFQPTVQDVVNMRVTTCGIIENNFSYSGKHFTLIDVGGQRSQRRKWIHFFDHVDSLIYLVAINQYDKVIEEDKSTNRIHESMLVFDYLCNNTVFAHKAVILFLNKIDLFRTKIKSVPLSVCFPNYKGNNTYDDASDYILNEFTQIYHDGNEKLYSHFTCATDTESIKVIFKRTVENIGKQNFNTLGLM